MLIQASEKLGLQPEETMKEAEDLYLNGFITYPRTETTSYPKDFSFQPLLAQLKNDQRYAAAIGNLPRNFTARTGTDCGDHAPITVTSKQYSGNSKLYTLIADHFVRSLQPQYVVKTITSEVKIGSTVLTTTKTVDQDFG